MSRGDPGIERSSLLRTSLVVTLVSVVGAWLGAELTDVDLASRLQPSSDALLLGLLLAAPLVVMLLVLKQIRWRPIRRLFEVVHQILGPALSECTTLELVAVSLGAGVSEELVFRGLLAEWSRGLGVPGMLIVPNLLFGLLHAVTFTYAVFAFGIGLYFSAVLYLVPNADLTSLMAAHAIYDLVCFVFLRRSAREIPQDLES